MKHIRFLRVAFSASVSVACAAPRPVGSTVDSAAGADSAATAAAVAVATKRMRDHGDAGLSIDDVKRTRDWFTPQLYALIIRDWSRPGEIGVGYLNWDPFTNAQDDVGPPTFEGVRRAGDTMMVRFSREYYEHRKGTVTLAMRRVNGTWRIADFIYPEKPPCYRDLAAALARYDKVIAEKGNPDGPCRE